MRGAGTRGIGALVAAAAIAASCGWPEFAYEPANGGDAQGGEESAGADTGGMAGAQGVTGGRGGASPSGGTGGSTGIAACQNHALDPPETDVDCGGGLCPKCAPGASCVVAVDCAERTCTSHGVCELTSCGNDKADGTETDKDCGGSDCEARCKAGDECRESADCESGLCENAHCVSGTCDPATGPCGTSDCLCANGRDCTTHDDCASGNCAGGSCDEGPHAFSRNDAADFNSPQSAAIRQTFLVKNDAPSDIPLAELALRYYFSRDDVTDQRAQCDIDRAAGDICTGVSTPLFAVESPYADTFLEVRFVDAPLRAGAQTSEVPVTVAPKDGHFYDQTDDYSFAANPSLAVNSKVTLYRRGVLISGEPPP